MTTTPDTLSLTLTVAQAERLLALVDAENAAQKNRCVGALNPIGTDGPTPERIERAVALALDVDVLTTLRANIKRRLTCTMARPMTAREHLGLS